MIRYKVIVNIQQLIMEKNRFIYSSAEKRKTPNLKNRKKKKPKLIHNSSLEDIAKVYLQNPRMLPKTQIKALIRTGRNTPAGDKSNFMINRLVQELHRRDVQSKFKGDDERQYSASNKDSKEGKFLNQNLSFIIEEQYRPNVRPKEELHSSLKPIRTNNFSSHTHYKGLRNKRKQISYSISPIENKLQSFHKKADKIKQTSQNKTIDNELSLSKKKKQFSRSNESIRSVGAKSPQKQIIIPSKIFSINEKNELVSKFLMKQGWRQSSLTSNYYTLKWTYNESLREYEILKSQNKKGKTVKYYNHIPNNLLVTKNGFHYISHKLLQKGIRIRQFIPLTFEFPDAKQQFIEEYQKSCILVLLKKHLKYLKGKVILNEMKIQRPQALMQIIKNKDYKVFLSHTQKHKTVIHLPLVIGLLIHCQNIYNSLEGEDCQEFDGLYRSILKDQGVLRMLLKYSKAQLPFQHYVSQRSSDEKEQVMEEKISREKFKIEGENGYIRIKKPFITPSAFLIGLLLFFDRYFKKHSPSYKYSHGTSLWISKPCAGSKGYGINILQNFDQIQKIFDKQRIIQKYVDNIWISPSSWKTKQNQFKGKKFDIRQWVLLNPPKAYIFSHFYLKICSKKYRNNVTIDPQVHLSNYSLNKGNFKASQQSSVMSQDKFASLLIQNSMRQSYLKLKKKIKQKIQFVVEQGLFHCDRIQGCFEIIGFDILIDKDFNPWIIQANMSPACQMRTAFLQQMREQMTSQALQIVMGGLAGLVKTQEKEQEKYSWKQLKIRQITKDFQRKQAFSIVGTKIVNSQGGKKTKNQII